MSTTTQQNAGNAENLSTIMSLFRTEDLSDRIAVLHKGGLTGLVTNGPGITKSRLGALMMGLENVYGGSRGTAGRDHE